MKSVPIIPTILVGFAIALMIALGFWQLLDRLPQKEAYLAQLARNPTRPVLTFPALPDDSLLFRQARGLCVRPGNIHLAGAGASGFRAIASCAPNANGMAMIVQLGITADPNAKVHWNGGPVTGYIGHAPSSRSLIGSLFDHRPEPLMLVAQPPVAGLAPNQGPDVDAVPNNHLAYAVQWFLFAAIAAIIYTVAIWRRRHPVVSPPVRG